jgi:RNA recognition motif-containing protein
MSTDEQATAAQEKFNGFTLNGRALRVNEATEKPAGSFGSRPGGFDSRPRSRPKGSRRNVRARKRGF